MLVQIIDRGGVYLTIKCLIQFNSHCVTLLCLSSPSIYKWQNYLYVLQVNHTTRKVRNFWQCMLCHSTWSSPLLPQALLAHFNLCLDWQHVTQRNIFQNLFQYFSLIVCTTQAPPFVFNFIQISLNKWQIEFWWTTNTSTSEEWKCVRLRRSVFDINNEHLSAISGFDEIFLFIFLILFIFRWVSSTEKIIPVNFSRIASLL